MDKHIMICSVTDGKSAMLLTLLKPKYLIFNVYVINKGV